jgi:uncharacterized protein involved in type VI secretion and phage assembly
MTATYFGKYRGIVKRRDDPKGRGRLRLLVPDISGYEPSTWAEPCFPFVGAGIGLCILPEKDSLVWVEFEQGCINHPVWTGGRFADKQEAPNPAKQMEVPLSGFVAQTSAGHFIAIDESESGGVVIQTKKGAKIELKGQSILISNGAGAEIHFDRNTVTINKDGLKII